MSEAVKVAVRCRPFNDREKNANSVCIVEMQGNTTILKPIAANEKEYKFTFDYSYWSHSKDDANFADNNTVFNDLGTLVLDNAFQGFNTSLFAYGQTGSGKSYSMVGYGADKGIIPKVSDHIFQRIEAQVGSEVTYAVECTMIEIYNEEIRDLLNPTKNPPNGMKIRDNPKTGPYVEGLTPVLVRNYNEISSLMDKGTAARTVASTNMNKTSSRAHTLFTIIFTQTFNTSSGKATQKVSKINLVDLAGSEKLGSTGATGQTMKEGININLSLTNLGNCISALAEKSTKNPKAFVPYRNSVLTHIMKESLGGNSKTIMIAALSPASINHDETLSTLRYADRAKRIQNKAIVNEDPNVRLINELKAEIEMLRQQLQNAGPAHQSQQQPNQELTLEDADESEAIKLQEELEQTQKLIAELQMSNEEKQKRAQELEQERNEALEKYGVLQQNVTKNTFDRLKHIHLVNLNEDPQMSDKLIYPLLHEETIVGSAVDNSTESAILLNGVGVLAQHAVISIENFAYYQTQKDNSQVKLFVEPARSEARVYVNGSLVSERTELKHADRLIFGMNHFFRVVLPDPSNLADKPQLIDWETAVQELADKLAQEKAFKIITAEKEQNQMEQTRKLQEFEEKMTAQRAALEKQVQQERVLFKLKKATLTKKIEAATATDEEKEKATKDLEDLKGKMGEIETREQKYLEEMQAKEAEFKKQMEKEAARYQKLEQEKERIHLEKSGEHELLLQTAQVNQAFMGLVPLINEANFISNKLQKDTTFEMRFSPVTMQLDVQLRNEDTQWESIWTVDTFTTRLNKMIQLYNAFEEGHPITVGPEDDPFFDIEAAAKAGKPYKSGKGVVSDVQKFLPPMPAFNFSLPSVNDPFHIEPPKLQPPAANHKISFKALKVEVIEGDNLEIKDWNSSDPYCVVKFGRIVIKTKTVMSSLKPKWNASFMIDLDSQKSHDGLENDKLKFEVWDYDKITADDFMGNTSIPLKIIPTGTTDFWLNLENCAHGRIHVRISTLNYQTE